MYDGRVRDFRSLVAATGSANLADGIGSVAFPWLAAGVTRSPTLIAGVVVSQRLPWLVMSLPAGVMADRFNRQRILVTADVLRGFTVLLVAVAVLRSSDLTLSVQATLDDGTNVVLYLVVILATLVLGGLEVVRDNAGQTLVPAMFGQAQADLERANGQLWAVERGANTLLGPAVGALLIGVSFALPLFGQSLAFFAAGVCAMFVPRVAGGAHLRPDSRPPEAWGVALRTGISWLWRQSLLRTMALALGGLNLAGWIGAGTYVLFAQEVMGVGPVLFAVVGFGGAVGGVVGGFAAPRVTARLGSGRSLIVATGGLMAVALAIAIFPSWPVVMVLGAFEFFFVTLWSVVTLSLRQAIVPSGLFGRVNSSYRFLGWGAIPVGAFISGLTVTLTSNIVSREVALRSVWILAAAVYAVVFVATIMLITDERMEAERRRTVQVTGT